MTYTLSDSDDWDGTPAEPRVIGSGGGGGDSGGIGSNPTNGGIGGGTGGGGGRTTCGYVNGVRSVCISG